MAATIFSQQSGYNFLANAGIYVIESDLMGTIPPYTPSVVNLNAYMEIYEEQGANFVKIATAKAPYSSLDKRTQFVIRELIDYNLEAGIPFSTTSNASSTNAFIKKIMVKVADSYGSPPQPEELIDGQEELIIHGGTQAREPAHALDDDYFVAHNYARPGAPRKRVHKSQPDWIYIFSKSDAQLEHKIKVYLDTGATHTENVGMGANFHSLFADQHSILISGWDMYSMDQKLEDAMVSGIPYAYDHILVFADTTEIVIPFQLELRPQPWGNFILHYNGMGGFETLWLSGKGQFGFEPTADEVTKYNVPVTPDSYDYQDANLFTRGEMDVNTGWQHRYAMEHLEQLFLGPCFWIDDAQFKPVTFERQGITTRRDDRAQQFNTGLTMRHRWRNKYYNRL